MFSFFYKYKKKIADEAQCAFTYYKQNNSDIARNVGRECLVGLRVDCFSLMYSFDIVY